MLSENQETLYFGKGGIMTIIQHVREMIGLDSTSTDFEAEVKMLINASLSILIQNGIGKPNFELSDISTWDDFKDPIAKGNEQFPLVPTYVYLKTKLAFDPPPQLSTVEFYKEYTAEVLWRLRDAYELPTIREEVSTNEFYG